MKKIVLLTLVSFACLTVFSQKPVRKGVKPITISNSTAPAKYQVSQLNGKWQEYKRANRGDLRIIGFTDSLQIHVRGVNAELREGNTMNMNMKGQARITAPNILEIAGDTYTILSLNGSELVIDDGEYRRTLKKIKTFHYETLGKQEIKPEEFSTPIVANLPDLKGKWIVYRTKALPGFVSSGTNLIKTIDIKSDSLGRYATGNISFHKNDLLQTQPVHISFEGKDMVIRASSDSWNLYLYKLDKGELVFGKTGELVYYAKPL